VTVEAEKRDIERSIAAETQRMVGQSRMICACEGAEAATEQAMREATGQGGLTVRMPSGCENWNERRR